MSKEIFEHAIKYADLGWAVHPVNGKRPILHDWPNAATKEIEQLHSLFVEQYPEANIALATGKRSGIVAVDVDAGHGGLESLEKYEKDYGSLPTTVTAKTGGGGKHLLFSHPNITVQNRTSFLPGIDFKADRGTIVIAPSIHPNGNRYDWEEGRSPFDIRVASLPDSLLKLIITPPNEVVSSKGFLDQGSIKFFREGTRNSELFRIACSLRAKGFNHETLLLSILSLNQAQCSPPLSDEEVKCIVESAFNYQPNSEQKNPRYIARSGCVYFIKEKLGEHYEEQLSNFVPKIVREEIRDNGLEQKITFSVVAESARGINFPEISISSETFPHMNWVYQWGAHVIMGAGQGKKDLLRVATQEFSTDIKRITIYTHAGWKTIDGTYYFLHEDGAIGPEGLVTNIEVDLSESQMTDFRLPEPPGGFEEQEAIRASLHLLKVADPNISYVLLASIYRAPLNEALTVRFILYIFGKTGSFKTEVAGILAGHFGHFNGSNLPANLSSTANSNEKKAFIAKDCLVPFDDHIPGITSDRDLQRIIRSQSNSSARFRMGSQADIRPAFTPRGLMVITAEDIISKLSSVARLGFLEFLKDTIDQKILSELQKYNMNGFLRKAMSAYLQWLSPRMDQLKRDLPIRHAELRMLAADSDVHRRTPDMIASIAIGLEVFLQFAKEKGVLTEEEAKLHQELAWKALGKFTANQIQYQRDEDHAGRFVELISTALFSGKAHVVSATGDARPEDASKWGWRLTSGGDYFPQGDRIGWLRNPELYLHPGAAYAVAIRQAQTTENPFKISQNSLWKRLAEKGLILKSDSEGKNLLKREIPNAGRTRVLVFLDAGQFINQMSDQKGSEAPEAPEKNGEGAGLCSAEQLEEVKKRFTEIRNKNKKGKL